MTTNDYDTCILEYKIHSEYQLLLKHKVKLKNVYVIPSASSSFIWYGVIFVKEGIYEKGIFRFTLFIPDNLECPRVIFNPIVYHPLINSDSGELDIKQFFPIWRKNYHHMFHVLIYVRSILNLDEIDVKISVNKEAAKLYENDIESFKKKVKLCIDECNKKIYEPPPINADDPHAIRFSQQTEENLNKLKLNMINSINNFNSQNDSFIKSNSSSSSNSSNNSTKNFSNSINNQVDNGINSVKSKIIFD